MANQRGATRQSAQRRATRQEQIEQRRVERERALKRDQRRRQIRRFSLFGGGGLLIALVAILIVVGTHSASGSAVVRGTGTYDTPVTGDTRDGMTCLGAEGAVEHIHMYLAIYINGQQVQVPPNTGILGNGSCYYPLHVHSDGGDENIIHEESPNNDTYTLGAFFDVWGQPLSASSVMGYKADATHSLTFVTFDGNGHKTAVTGNPLNITFSEHETIYILYNSPKVTPTPFTKWINGE